jgi:hypothetical protein
MDEHTPKSWRELEQIERLDAIGVENKGIEAELKLTNNCESKTENKDKTRPSVNQRNCKSQLNRAHRTSPPP